MAAYPEIASIKFMAPVHYRLRFKTLVQAYESENESRKQKLLYPKRDFNLKYKNITDSDATTLWKFFVARAGGYAAFNFFDRATTRSYVSEYVGVGDGSNTVFNLPSKSAGSVTLYSAGSALTAGGVDWTFASGGGDDGADKATFVTAPDSGSVITIDFTGQLKVHSVFANDSLDFDVFYVALVTMGISIRGLLNE